MATRGRDDARVQGAAAQPGLIDRSKLVLGAVALGALLLFLLQNLQEADVHFFWFDWSTRMVWALLVSAIAGALAAILIGTLSRRRDRKG